METLQLIIPDLPLKEYQKDYKTIIEQYKLNLIFLITPQTDLERIRLIDGISSGFIYLVTSSNITGNTTTFKESQLSYLDQVRGLALKNPILAGFGICNKTNFDTVNKYVNGAIIGSEFIRALNKDPFNLEYSIKNFVNSILL